MKAIVLDQFGGVQNFRYTDVPVPQPGAGQVQVAVKAIGINPVDAKTRAGNGWANALKDEMPLILGWDVAGIVTAVGEGVTVFTAGDAVFGMLEFPAHAKAYAEYVVADAKYLALKPANISFEAAAGATLAALTAYQSIVHALKVQPGERVLVHAASGGVGHYAVQILKNLGAYVIATSSAGNKDFVMSLEADEFIDYKTQVVEEVAKDVDVVLDSLGGDAIDKSLTVLKPGGRMVSYPGAHNAPTIAKAAAVGRQGVTFLVEANGDDMNALAGLLEQGVVTSHISQTFAFDAMAQAHLQIESGRTVGKIVVMV